MADAAEIVVFDGTTAKNGTVAEVEIPPPETGTIGPGQEGGDSSIVNVAKSVNNEIKTTSTETEEIPLRSTSSSIQDLASSPDSEDSDPTDDKKLPPLVMGGSRQSSSDTTNGDDPLPTPQDGDEVVNVNIETGTVPPEPLVESKFPEEIGDTLLKSEEAKEKKSEPQIEVELPKSQTVVTPTKSEDQKEKEPEPNSDNVPKSAEQPASSIESTTPVAEVSHETITTVASQNKPHHHRQSSGPRGPPNHRGSYPYGGNVNYNVPVDMQAPVVPMPGGGPGYVVPYTTANGSTAYFAATQILPYTPTATVLAEPMSPSTLFIPAGAGDLALQEVLKRQIEYYFSEENLAKDVYLRRFMDDEGYVPIEIIANFRRVRTMSEDLTYILSAIKHSTVMELKDNSFVRPKENPTKWVISKSAVEPEIKHVSHSPRGSGTGEMLTLNPDVPEFVPQRNSTNGIIAGPEETSWRSNSRGSLTARNTSGSGERNSSPYPEELNFEFDEDIGTGTTPAGPSSRPSRQSPQRHNSVGHDSEHEDEWSDSEIDRLVIVTQRYPNRINERGSGSNAGSWRNNSGFPNGPAMTQDMAQTINDGLRQYEQQLYNRRYSEQDMYGRFPPGPNTPTRNFFDQNVHRAMNTNGIYNLPPPPFNTPVVGSHFPGGLLQGPVAQPGGGVNILKKGGGGSGSKRGSRQGASRFYPGQSSSGRENHVGWIMDYNTQPSSRRVRTTSISSTASSSGTSPGDGSLSSSLPQALHIPHHPSHSLLEENGFVQQYPTTNLLKPAAIYTTIPLGPTTPPPPPGFGTFPVVPLQWVYDTPQPGAEPQLEFASPATEIERPFVISTTPAAAGQWLFPGPPPVLQAQWANSDHIPPAQVIRRRPAGGRGRGRPRGGYDYRHRGGYAYRPRGEYDNRPRGDYDYRTRDEYGYRTRDEYDNRPRGDYDYRTRDEYDYRPRGDYDYGTHDEYYYRPRGEYDYRPRRNGRGY